MPPALRGALPSLLNSTLLMGTPKYLLSRFPACPGPPFLPRHHFHRLLPFFPSPRFLNPAAAHVSPGASSHSLRSRPMHTLSPVTSNTVQLGMLDDDATKVSQLEILKSKLQEQGIPFGSGTPGQYAHLLCPKCGGGDSKERSFSLFIREDGQLAMWSCFRAKCGWRGHLQASEEGKAANSHRSGKLANYRVITEEGLQLEPLCNEVRRMGEGWMGARARRMRKRMESINDASRLHIDPQMLPFLLLGVWI